MSIDLLDCTNLDCESELPPVSFDPCNTSIKYNEIEFIYLMNEGYPFTNWTDPAEWAARLSMDSSDPNAVRRLTVRGTLDVEPGDRTRIAGGRFIPLPATYTLTGLVDDNNQINYDFMRALSCNRPLRAFFQTTDGDLYSGTGANGGNLGIAVVMTGYENITDDFESFRPLMVEGEWQSVAAPLRIPSPIA